MATVAAVFFQTPDPRTPEEVVQRLFAPSQPVLNTAQGKRPCRFHD
jgi:hypothetical protein